MSPRPIGLLRPALLAMLLAGCMSTPNRDLDLERIESALTRLETDPALATLAPAEIARARDAVRELNAATSDSQRDQLAYLAERRVDIAYAAAQAAGEREKLEQLEREHDRILLAASRRDAELARLEAEKARLQSLARAEEAERAREEVAQAQAAQALSVQDAEAARKQAEQAKRLAAAQAAEAQLARQEADLAVEAADSLRMQMQSLTAREEARGKVMTLGEAVFAPGQAALQPDALANLDRVVEFVGADPLRPIRIEGHTDDRGGDNLNQALSQRRADAVRQALVARGVDASRIRTVGLGKSRPVATNATAEGRARNRRVEVILEAAGG